MRLRLRGTTIDLCRGRPLLMGIVNATPDSFSEPPGAKPFDELVARAHAQADAGAGIVDVGGESGRTDRAAVSEDEESRRVEPLVRRLVSDGLLVSVDTWRVAPARAALAAGAAMINDVSGLADPRLADLCAEHEAALVITHTRSTPKVKALPRYDSVMADVLALLTQRVGEALRRGVDAEQLLLDPGLDLAKTPAETVAVLRSLGELERFDRPLLLAISRKDFVGALTERSPADRGAGTLAAIEPALDLPAAVLRVHDVAAAADFLRVRAALRGDATAADTPLAEPLRREGASR